MKIKNFSERIKNLTNFSSSKLSYAMILYPNDNGKEFIVISDKAKNFLDLIRNYNSSVRPLTEMSLSDIIFAYVDEYGAIRYIDEDVLRTTDTPSKSITNMRLNRDFDKDSIIQLD